MDMNVRRGGALIRPRLLLAEDHIGMRERVVQMVESSFDVVGVVGDGCAFLEAASRMKPDVCVIDISLPGLSGIEAASQLRELGSTARLVFLTMHEDPDYLRAALGVGAAAYVVKSRMASDLCLAIKEAMAGRLFVSPSVPYVTQNDQGEDAP
jgi:DNA-binding NarL/FixJ family response regulator